MIRYLYEKKKTQFLKEKVSFGSMSLIVTPIISRRLKYRSCPFLYLFFFLILGPSQSRFIDGLPRKSIAR